MSEGERKTVLGVGGVGHFARGGGLRADRRRSSRKAALEFDPKEARGLDGALLELTQQPYGRPCSAASRSASPRSRLWCSPRRATARSESRANLH